MNHTNMPDIIILMVLAALLLGSCAPATLQTTAEPILPSITSLPPSSTSPPPTDTPLPPTEIPTATLTPSATPVPSVDGVSGMVEVNGLNLYYECYGEGDPTVVVEAGLGASIKDWHKIMYMIAPYTRICSYYRPGDWRSDEPPAYLTSQDLVNYLRTLLSNAGIPGPYILVGHSAGALNVLLYGYRYPEEVAGMVLLDPSNPVWATRLRENLPTPSPGEALDLSGCRQSIERFLRFWNTLGNAGRWDLAASVEQVQTITSLGDLPLVVITAGVIDSDCPGKFGEMERQFWRDLHAEYARLSTNGVQITAENSNHFIHQRDPQLVVDTILKLVEQVRGD